jgi:hypothetical protein
MANRQKRTMHKQTVLIELSVLEFFLHPFGPRFRADAHCLALQCAGLENIVDFSRAVSLLYRSAVAQTRREQYSSAFIAFSYSREVWLDVRRAPANRLLTRPINCAKTAQLSRMPALHIAYF